jgi:hypothetical protein
MPPITKIGISSPPPRIIALGVCTYATHKAHELGLEVWFNEHQALLPYILCCRFPSERA